MVGNQFLTGPVWADTCLSLCQHPFTQRLQLWVDGPCFDKRECEKLSDDELKEQIRKRTISVLEDAIKKLTDGPE